MDSKKRKAFSRIVLLALVIVLCGCAGHRNLVSDGNGEAFSRMTIEARKTPVIFIGEYHDQRAHHQLQLKVVKALHDSGLPLALGVEMFDIESQESLDQWGAGKLALLDLVRRYRENWTIDWSQYDTLFLYARNNSIPVIGLNPPDDLVAKVAHLGFDRLTSRDRQRLAPGVDVSVSDSYRKFLRDSFADHGISEERFAPFCEAQALRNSTFARRIGDFLRHNPGTTVVVLTGIGHAMRRAVPADLSKEGFASTVIIPSTDELPDGIVDGDADFFVIP